MKLPPLNSVRNFEAAARYGSFRRAAQELCVTEGAVSRQIKALEAYLGTALFLRHARHVELTAAGRRLYEVVHVLLSDLARTAHEIKERRDILRLEASTSFVTGWLLQRLDDFETRSNIPVRLQSGTILTIGNILSTDFDASIVYLFDLPATDDDHFVHIVDESMVPVCAPSLLPGGRKLTRDELGGQRLLFNEYTGRDWKRWSAIVGLEPFLNWEHAVRFDGDNAAIHAAQAGHGIALSNLLYVADLLREGQLVLAIDCPPIVIGAHFLYFRHLRSAELPRVVAFRDWLLNEARQDYRSIASATWR